MIIWNCQKVNSSDPALKPLPRLPNVPKVAYVWDILIFQAPLTFIFTGESPGAYLQLEYIGQQSTLKEFEANSYPLTLNLTDDCMRVVKSFYVSKGVPVCFRV